MNTNEKFYVIEGMINYGGSFVSALGTALSHADDINSEKIKWAFEGYWKQYFEMGKKRFEEKNKELKRT